MLHGLLRYSTGFFAGRHLHQVCVELLQLGGSCDSKQVSSFVDYAKKILALRQPRVLSLGRVCKPVLIFTDGAWENGVGGIGVVVADTASGERWVLSGQVPQRLIDQKKVGDQLICQIELFVAVWTRMRMRALLRDRRSIWWIDNEAARHCLIKGVSPIDYAVFGA